MKHSFKKIFSPLLALTLCFSLTACGNGKNSKKNDSSLTDFTVVLDWYPNAVHSFIYDAIEKGYYKEEGLNVKVQFPSNTNDAISMTAAGKADIGLYYQHDIIMARATEDIPVKAVGTVCQKPLNIVLSLKDQNISSPADLVGKKIGYAGTVLSEAFIAQMMEHCGKSVDDVQMIDVGFDLMNSMTTKNVNATIGGMVNHELPQMEEDGFEMNHFSPTDYGVPNYYELVFVTGEKQLNKDSENVKKFLRASAKGFEDMKNDPDGTLNILLDNQNEENFPLSKTVEKQSMDCLLPVMETTDASFLSQDKSVWEENINWLYDQKVINSKPDASEFFVDLYEK